MKKQEMYQQLAGLGLGKFDLVLIGDEIHEYGKIDDDTLGVNEYADDEELKFNNNITQMKITSGEWLEDQIRATTVDDEFNLYEENYELVGGNSYKYRCKSDAS